MIFDFLLIDISYPKYNFEEKSFQFVEVMWLSRINFAGVWNQILGAQIFLNEGNDQGDDGNDQGDDG